MSNPRIKSLWRHNYCLDYNVFKSKWTQTIKRNKDWREWEWDSIVLFSRTWEVCPFSWGRCRIQILRHPFSDRPHSATLLALSTLCWCPWKLSWVWSVSPGSIPKFGPVVQWRVVAALLRLPWKVVRGPLERQTSLVEIFCSSTWTNPWKKNFFAEINREEKRKMCFSLLKKLGFGFWF